MALLLLAPVATRTALPPFGVDGLWFYSAVAGLILGEFLLEPFFTRPADSIANGATLLLTTSTASVAGADVSGRAAHIGRIVFIGYAVAILLLGALAVLFKDTQGERSWIARSSYSLVGVAGRARWMFGALYFAAVYAAFSKHSGRVALLYLAWIIVFSLHPLERLTSKLGDRRASGLLVSAGRVTGIEEPSVVRASLPALWEPHLGQSVSVKSPKPQMGCVVDVTKLALEPIVKIALEHPLRVRHGDSVELLDRIDKSVIGHVSDATTIDDLSVVTAPSASERGLQEGRLVQASMANANVLFQVTAARIETRSDISDAQDSLRISARKLGIWNEDGRGFDPVPWVPDAGTSVHVFAGREAPIFEAESIGHLPGTEYGVRLDLDAAVTHNTAILGILGIGKTHLAWEIMKRLLLARRKIVALDITGRYAPVFEEIASDAVLAGVVTRVNESIAPTLNNMKVVDNEAGNVVAFRSAIREELASFYGSECPILIINPLDFYVTKMEGRPTFQQTAVTLSHLTMVEITQIIAESLLNIMMEQDRNDPNINEEARLCLILEEAHSLVPEWNAATGEAEKWAVNGTVRAILQGRKYGFGCLLITQRTASVTKSILNQCNTIFALRAYDATGTGFLEHYVGPVYAPMLASLKERQAVIFGRASSCAAPVVIELNDAATFDQEVWRRRIGEVQRCDGFAGPPSGEDGHADEAPAADVGEPVEFDDIPF